MGDHRSRCTVVELEMSFSHIAVLIYGTILLSVSFAVPIEDVAPLEDIPSTGGDNVLAALQDTRGRRRRWRLGDNAECRKHRNCRNGFCTYDTHIDPGEACRDGQKTCYCATPSPRSCCKALPRRSACREASEKLLQGLACSRGVSVKQFCKWHAPGKYGCPKTRRRRHYGRRRRWGLSRRRRGLSRRRRRL